MEETGPAETEMDDAYQLLDHEEPPGPDRAERSEADRIEEATDVLQRKYAALNFDAEETEASRLHWGDVWEQNGWSFKEHERHVVLWRWIAIVVVGFNTGVVAFFINAGIFYIGGLRDHMVGMIVAKGEGWAGLLFLSLAAFSVGAAGIATSLVVGVAPLAAGSGIPEIRSWLNGTRIPTSLSLRVLAAKVVGVLFSVVAGLPVGKEGPMIHSGAICGAGVSQGGFGPHIRWDPQCSEAFQNNQEKKEFVAVGAAVGVSVAFKAPIGGVLFALEEGCSHINDSISFKCFVGAVVGSITTKWLTVLTFHEDEAGPLNIGSTGLAEFGAFGTHVHDYDPGVMTVSAAELPFLIALGAIGGILGHLFIRLNMVLAKWRLLSVNTKPKKAAEVLVITFGISIWVFLIGLVPYLVNPDQACKTLPASRDLSGFGWAYGASCVAVQDGEYDGGCKSLFQTFYCTGETGGTGTWNQWGTLSLGLGEKALVLLYHSSQNLSYAALLLIALLYFLSACVTYGIAVPSGTFIPCMVMGALWGRAFGQALQATPYFSYIHPGVYALAGSAAMITGVVRVTISIAVVLLESTEAFTSVIPLFVAVIAAKLVGDYLDAASLFDAHLALKKVPLLHSDPPGAEVALLPASAVAARPVSVIKKRSTLTELHDTLTLKTHSMFPVVEEDGSYVGMIPRRYLTFLMSKHQEVFEKVGVAGIMEEHTVLAHIRYVQDFPTYPKIGDIDLPSDAAELVIDLSPYLTPAIALHRTVTLQRAYSIFRKLGLSHVCLTNDHAQVTGMIGRRELGQPSVERAIQQMRERAQAGQSLFRDARDVLASPPRRSMTGVRSTVSTRTLSSQAEEGLGPKGIVYLTSWLRRLCSCCSEEDSSQERRGTRLQEDGARPEEGGSWIPGRTTGKRVGIARLSVLMQQGSVDLEEANAQLRHGDPNPNPNPNPNPHPEPAVVPRNLLRLGRE